MNCEMVGYIANRRMQCSRKAAIISTIDALTLNNQKFAIHQCLVCALQNLINVKAVKPKRVKYFWRHK